MNLIELRSSSSPKEGDNSLTSGVQMPGSSDRIKVSEEDSVSPKDIVSPANRQSDHAETLAKSKFYQSSIITEEGTEEMQIAFKELIY